LSPLASIFLKLAVVAVPLVALAWSLRVYPDRRLVYLALVPGILSLALLGAPWLFWAVVAIDVAVALVILADLATLPPRSAFSVEREAVRVASLRKRHPVSLTVSNHSRRSFPIEVRDGVPHLLDPKPAQFAIALGARSRATWDYVLRPGRRGAFVITRVHVKAQSRLRLWQRLLRYPCETSIHVYPDMQQLREYAVLARTNRLSQVGVRRTRRIGQDHDFERLRDYTIDDNYKHMDWRATARRQKLTVKDFQTTQRQRIMFLVDCGRMMTNEAMGLSLLDHALNAVLMLSYVALSHNDTVGLVCFSDEIHAYVPPRGGMNQMNRLLRASFDRFPRLVESRYDEAFRRLASHSRKRSLVVLVTNVIDEVNAGQVQQYLTNLVGRHLPLGVLLRDRRIFDAVEVAPGEDEALWQAAAAAHILAWRHQVLADLTSKGALTLDVFPEQMTAPLVNRYLEIKARHLL
jgi:uncharacterized protein (DUF58 family)